VAADPRAPERSETCWASWPAIWEIRPRTQSGKPAAAKSWAENCSRLRVRESRGQGEENVLVGVEVVLQVLESQSVVEDLTEGQLLWSRNETKYLHVGDLGGGGGGDGGGSGEDGSGGGELHLD